MLASLLNPISAARDMSTIAARIDPDCEKYPTVPGRGNAPPKLALSGVAGHMIPMQLGPMNRIPADLAVRTSACSSSAPSGPSSLNPDETTIAALTPLSAHACIAATACLAATTITARSTGPSIDLRSGYDLSPCTSWQVGLTG